MSEPTIPIADLTGLATDTGTAELTAALARLADHIADLADRPIPSVVATMPRGAVPGITALTYWRPASDSYSPRSALAGWAVWSDGEISPIVYGISDDISGGAHGLHTLDPGISWRVS